MASPSVSSSRTHVREVRMLTGDCSTAGLRWHPPPPPAAATVLAGAEPTVLNGEESGKVAVA